jgi:hypothetical protein
MSLESDAHEKVEITKYFERLLDPSAEILPSSGSEFLRHLT